MIYYFFIYSRHGQCREAFKLVKNIKESSPVEIHYTATAMTFPTWFRLQIFLCRSLLPHKITTTSKKIQIFFIFFKILFTALSFKIALHSQRLCYFIVGRCPDGQNYIFDY